MAKGGVGNESKADVKGAMYGKPTDQNPVKLAGRIATAVKVGGLPKGMSMPKVGKNNP